MCVFEPRMGEFDEFTNRGVHVELIFDFNLRIIYDS